jgi:hypothetical protein
MTSRIRTYIVSACAEASRMYLSLSMYCNIHQFTFRVENHRGELSTYLLVDPLLFVAYGLPDEAAGVN